MHDCCYEARIRLIWLFEQLRWIGSEQERPWEWHWMRIRLSLSKGKTKMVKKLAAHNLELEEILGYSERITPIAEARSLSKPIALFDKIRHLACVVHNVLESHWTCHSRNCRTHRALLSLRSEIETVDLYAIFITEDEQASSSKSLKQEVMIHPADADVAADKVNLPINYAQQGVHLAALQEGIESSIGKKKKPTSSQGAPQTSISGTATVTTKKKARFDQSALVGTTNRSASTGSPSTSGTSANRSHIIDLCSSLRKSSDASLGIMIDQHSRQIQLTRCAKPGRFTTAPDTVGLRPLSQILRDHHNAIIDVPRQRRFGMALHVACALLQIQMSPWLSHKWSKDEFQFLCDTQTVHSDNPHVCQVFFSNTTLTSGQGTCRPTATAVVITEDETRASLQIGVVILELLFGHNIEDCGFRRLYYGPNNQPNEWTDLCTARKWATKVLGECGVEIADVVRRCLDCSFGPRPNFQDKRFREAVYEGVIRPLADYSKIWQVAQP